jgi:hypothetical protein
MGIRRTALLAAAFVLLASTAIAPAGEARQGAPLTAFLAKRPGLEVKLWLDPWGIVATRTGSVVHCEDGSKEYGSITSQGWRHFPVDRRGEFKRGVWEAYEGSGSYFTRLAGSARANSVVGEYTAWEQRTGEEEFFPKCGTRSFRGEPMRFRAHRVAGPPWHSAR